MDGVDAGCGGDKHYKGVLATGGDTSALIRDNAVVPPLVFLLVSPGIYDG